MDITMGSPGLDRVVPTDARLDRIRAGTIFGEGPIWFAERGYLLWTDIIGDRIMQWQPGQGVSVFLQPSRHANGMTRDRQGRLIVAGYGDRNVWRMERDGSFVVLASHYQGKRIQCPNDIVVRSDGSIYWTESTGGLFHPGMGGDDLQQYLDFKAVFQLGPDGLTMTPVVDDFEAPNGLAFSPDESLLYINDTRRRHIRVFEVQLDGSLRNGRLFYEARGNEPGNPDGMKVDLEGNVFCTGPGGIHVISSRGDLLGVMRMPEHVSNMAWGDADWRTLYLTGRTSLYRVRLNIPGIPV